MSNVQQLAAAAAAPALSSAFYRAAPTVHNFGIETSLHSDVGLALMKYSIDRGHLIKSIFLYIQIYSSSKNPQSFNSVLNDPAGFPNCPVKSFYFLSSGPDHFVFNLAHLNLETAFLLHLNNH